ncbi:MAG: cytochrome b N-terminal domain-containing protein [Pseudomonadota bacterium]
MTRPPAGRSRGAWPGLLDWFRRRLSPGEGLGQRYRERQVPALTAWPQYFHRCLGGLSLVLLVLQLLSGLALLLYYRPEPDQALASLMHLESRVWGGWALRRLHAVAGNLLLLTVSLHMLKVLWRGAYKEPREFYWLSGLTLWLGSLLMLVSGGLLPGTRAAWQGLAALCHSLGLAAPSLESLGLVYALHLGLPWLMLLALWVHLAMVRRLGLAEPL